MSMKLDETISMPADFIPTLTFINQAFTHSRGEGDYQRLISELRAIVDGKDTEDILAKQFPDWTVKDIGELLAQHGDFVSHSLRGAQQPVREITAVTEEMVALTEEQLKPQP